MFPGSDRRLVVPAMVVAAVLVLLTFSTLHKVRHPENLVGLDVVGAAEGGVAVETVTPTGAAQRAGVRGGDRIVAVAGVSVEEPEDYRRAAESFGLDRATPVTLIRDGDHVTVEIRPGSLSQLLLRVPLVLFYLGIGLVALRVSPGYLNGRLLFYFASSVALELSLPWSVALQGVELLVETSFYVLTGLQMGLLLHLSILIPERPRWIERRSWVIPCLYGAGIALAAVTGSVRLAPLLGLRTPWTWEQAVFLFRDVGFPVWALALLVVLGHRAVTYPGTEGRVQAGIVFLGTVPWAVWVGLMTLFRFLEQAEPAWLGAVQFLGFFSYPAAVLLVLSREARKVRRELESVAERAQEADSPQEVAEALTTALHTGLHPKWVAVLYRRPAREGLDLVAFAGDESRRETAERLASLVELPPGGPRELDLATGELGADGARGSSLCLGVPLRGRGRELLGVVLLGEKSSEEPYTLQNRRRLSGLASRVGLVLQNMHLTESIRRSDGRGRTGRGEAWNLRGLGVDLARECPGCGRCYGPEAESCERCDVESLDVLPIELLVATRYRLERRLGSGGMGTVFEAEDLRLGRHVALKALLPPQLADLALERFEREARISARLSHPNIVSIHDFGLTESGGAFLVMERLHGSSLRDVIHRFGSIRPETAAEWFEQLLTGLGAAHEEDVIHRDLKPGNVFLVDRAEASERVKILDFGLAKLRSTEISVLATVTRPGSILGTLPYMAPEQLEGAPLDQRTDLFAVGVMVVEALTGIRPFRGDTTQAISYAIMNRDYSFPGTDPASRTLSVTLDRCLAKNPWERHASAEDLSRDLIPAIRALPGDGAAEASTLDLRG